MKITVNNKDYELKFSIQNINKLDQVFATGNKSDGFGMGTMDAISSLFMYDPVVLDKVITCVTSDDLTPEMIDNYIGSLSEKELGDLFESVIAEAKKSPMISLQWRRLTGKTMTQYLKAMQDKLKAMQKKLTE